MVPSAVLVAVASLLSGLQVSGVDSGSFSDGRRWDVSQLSQPWQRTAFVLNFDLLDWNEAYKACYALNHTLAFAKSAEEGENLLRFLVNLSDNSTKDIHLGFHSLFVKGTYVNMLGLDMDEVGFRQWDPLSENNPEQRCGGLTVDGMKTIDCNTKQESVCMYKESIDFDPVDKFGYYHYFDWKLNWTEAVAQCKLWNADLLVLRSTAEFEAVYAHFLDFIDVADGWDIFYGAHQLFSDRWFLTLNDEDLEETGFDTWLPGEPADVPSADFPFVGLRLADPSSPEADSGMFLVEQGTPLSYICKRELH